MKSLLLKSLFVLAFSALPVIAADNTIVGTWKVTGSVYGNPVEPICTFKQEDKKLTGICKFGEQPDSPLTGEVTNKKINWKTTVEYNGSPLDISFDGTLDDTAANITGKVNVPQMNVGGDFTAKKN